jgi:hypothetical protein
MKQMMARTDDNQEKMAINLKEIMAEMNAKMDDNQTERRFTMRAFWSELDETTACNGVTET